jgi:dally
VIEKFFHKLFPLAYHHAVHSRDADEESMSRDFHVDYKNCLEKSYDTLQPFGDIPNSVSRMMLQSVGAANTLLRSIEQGADIVGETERLNIDSLSDKCRSAILKLNYCATCKGNNYHHSRPCYGYCSNVVRSVTLN